MRTARLWRGLLGVEQTVIEGVEFDEDDEAVVAHVRPRKGSRGRCGRCGRRCAGYDRGEGRRRWRGLDLGTIKVFLEADAPRVACPEHGPTVVQVPWARHGARQTRAFEDTAAWLVTHTSKTAVGELLRVTWRTVGSMVTRVVGEARALRDPFDGLRGIGIDEISYKKGHFSGDLRLSPDVSSGAGERGFAPKPILEGPPPKLDVGASAYRARHG